jgi:hypothetical protein
VKEQRLWSKVFLAAGALAAVACYPLSFDDAAELDMVITRKAGDYDYSRNRTYFLPAEVVDICEIEDIPSGEGGAGGAVDVADAIDCEEVTHLYDQQILDSVRRNMNALGYQEVSDVSVEPPDVVMFVGTLATNNYVAYTYYPWWGYYPYYYWWGYYGWYWYYPYYPTTTVVNYPTGTVLMQMMGLQDADPITERVPGIWSGAFRGLLESSDDVSAQTRINQSIDQAFKQSPYLKVGP